VGDALPGSLLSAVDYIEVIGKCLDFGDDYVAVLRRFAALSVVVVAHDASLAQRAGGLRPLTKKMGRSLADRAAWPNARENACGFDGRPLVVVTASRHRNPPHSLGWPALLPLTFALPESRRSMTDQQRRGEFRP
jgi:hypothetical protein